MKRLQTLSAKVILSVISVIMILFLFFAGIFSYWSYERMIREYQQVLQTYTANVDSIFVNALTGIQSFSEWLYSTERGVIARHKEEYKLAETAGLIQAVNERVESYYQSVMIFNHNGKATFFSGHGISFPAHLEQKVEELAKGQEFGLNSIVWTTESRYEVESNVNLCSFFFQEANSGEEHYAGAVNVNVDLNALSKSIFSSKTDSGLETFIINQNGQILAHSRGKNIGKNIADKAYIQQILSQNDIYEAVEIDGRKMQIMSYKSAERGYYIVVQSEYLNVLAGTLNIIPIGILGLTFIFTIILVVFLFRKMFRPLNVLTQIVRNEYEYEYEVEKIYDDIKFLEQYYALNREYVQMLRFKECKNLVVKSLLQESWNSNMENYIVDKQIVTAKKPFCIVLIQIMTEDALEEDIITVYLKLRENVEKAFETALSNKMNCVCLELGLKRVLLVLSDKGENTMNRDSILQSMYEINQDLKTLQQIDILYAVSDCNINGQIEFDKMYTQAKERLQKQTAYPNVSESVNEKNKISGKNHSNQELIELLIDYLNNNYSDKDINISTLAHLFHIDKGYLGKA